MSDFAKCALCFCLAFFMCAANGYTVKDARGKIFEFASPPRCATVVPAVSQSICAIGADAFLVADSAFCDYPEAAAKKIKIGTYLNPDYEKIVELKPDLFILPSLSDERVKARLESLGIRCFLLHSEGLANIVSDVKMLGELFDRSEAANALAQKISTAVAPSQPLHKRALFMFGNMAAGKGSFVGGLMGVCGLENCADKIGKPWPVPSREFIIAQNPEIIFVETIDQAHKKTLENFYKTDPVWRTTDAVKNGRVYFIKRETIVIPSVRILQALDEMKRCLNK